MTSHHFPIRGFSIGTPMTLARAGNTEDWPRHVWVYGAGTRNYKGDYYVRPYGNTALEYYAETAYSFNEMSRGTCFRDSYELTHDQLMALLSHIFPPGVDDGL